MTNEVPAFTRGRTKREPDPEWQKVFALKEKYKDKFGDTDDIWNEPIFNNIPDFIEAIQKCIDTGKRFEYYYPIDENVIY